MGFEVFYQIALGADLFGAVAHGLEGAGVQAGWGGGEELQLQAEGGVGGDDGELEGIPGAAEHVSCGHWAADDEVPDAVVEHVGDLVGVGLGAGYEAEARAELGLQDAGAEAAELRFE